MRAWAYVFSNESDVYAGLVTSASVALSVAVAAVALALPAARALALYSFRGRRFCLWLLLLPLVAPPLAATMGLHRVLLAYGLTDTMAGVALCHLTVSMPYAVVALLGSFQRLDVDIESQARLLGARPRQVWWHVTLPMIAPGLAVAFSLAFLVSWSQYLITLIIGGGRIVTLPLQLVSFQRGGDEAVSAALAVVFLAPAVLVLTIMARYLRS